MRRCAVAECARGPTDQHGDDAGDFAARPADLLMEEGDADGAVACLGWDFSTASAPLTRLIWEIGDQAVL